MWNRAQILLGDLTSDSICRLVQMSRWRRWQRDII